MLTSRAEPQRHPQCSHQGAVCQPPASLAPEPTGQQSCHQDARARPVIQPSAGPALLWIHRWGGKTSCTPGLEVGLSRPGDLQ
ncbi:hypothetical protein N7449_012537 [Penicillium cf. viridicatum]|uniref:Uncharacterized protein n=1 Tax=Penicillium cf. viridicatum TaxID=2972119 RepID=A0A9W9LWU0_9EURO|nr:hypothetical protein N7449_012537 [Penicillium cf. viridicatum]